MEGAFEEGTVAAYSSTSLTLAANSKFQTAANHASNDFYNNMTVLIYEGDGIGESRRIIDYVGSTKVATIQSAFSGSVDNESKYKIYRWSGDNSTFGNADKINYIDKGGTTFPYDDIESIDSIDSYMLRTKVSSIGDNESKPLGFVTYNPSK